MDILTPGLDLIRALQSLGAWLLAPMQFLSVLGKEEFFLGLMPLLSSAPYLGGQAPDPNIAPTEAQTPAAQTNKPKYEITVMPPGGPAPRLPDGHPDFSGHWFPNGAGQGVSGRYGVDPEAIRQFDPKATYDVIAKGLNASPGAAVDAAASDAMRRNGRFMVFRAGYLSGKRPDRRRIRAQGGGAQGNRRMG